MNEPTREESIFLAALDKPAEERSAFLEGACLGDAQLLVRVRRLLSSHAESHGPLDEAPSGFDATQLMPSTSETSGTQIGPYKLREQIGEGGMGTVWMAEQIEPVRRMVALKIIKPGMDSSQVIARFEAERQALAMMDHPHIARVLDAGTMESGRPYFVMELVKGIPITQYCDEQRLAPAERLALFVPVCQAIQHAHQKGIIHRDIKPSNVLVAAFDGRPVPKVIDFGVAKATGQKLTDRTLFTGFGGIMGTIEYMSPEQAEFNARDIDTRSDVYSLGVLLYELLTGSTPLTRERLKEAALTELLRVVREEEPPPPSTRLSQSGNTLAAISAQRRTDAYRLPKLVRGELDWIVMKALEKDRARRYETANAMARDVEHYLLNEPVDACPPSAAYRLRKFVRRNTGTVVAVSLIALALVAGIAVSTSQALRAGRAERVATSEEQKAKQAADEAIAEKNRADASERTAHRNLYAAHMNLAHDAWNDGNVLRTVELLNEHIPNEGQEDLRSFEWRYLWQQSHQQKQTFTIAAPNEQAVMCAVSPDGRWLASGVIGPVHQSLGRQSGGNEYTLSKIELWDLTSGTLRHTIVDPGDDPRSGVMDKMYQELVFSTDGKLFATVEFDHPMIWEGNENARSGSPRMQNPRITIWDLETLTLRNQIPLPDFPLGDIVAISPDSKRIAAAYRVRTEADGPLMFNFTVWDLPDQRGGEKPADPYESFSRQLDIKSSVDEWVAFQFTPDSKSIVWRRQSDQHLTVADISDAGQDRSLPIAARAPTFSPDGKYIAGSTYVWEGDTVRAGGWRMVRLFDATTGETIHDFPVTQMDNRFEPRAAFSPDGRLLAVRRGATLHVWDIESKQQIGDLRGNTDDIRAVGFAADSRTVITVSRDKLTGNTDAKFWDINTRPGPDEFSLGKGPQRKTGEQTSEGEREHIVISGMDITTDGKTLFKSWSSLPSGPETHVVTLSDLSTRTMGKRVVELPIDPKLNFTPHRAVFSPDGQRLVMIGARFVNEIHLWRLANDPNGLKLTFERAFPALQRDTNRAPAVAFSQDGTKLVYAGSESDHNTDRLHLHEIASGKQTQFPADPNAWFPHFAGMQGSLLDGRWEGSCNGVAFSSDSRRIFSVHKRYILPWETRIIVWDAATLQALAVLESPQPLNYAWKPLALSPDDLLLATCQDDHSIFLWDVSEPELRRVHDELARRAPLTENKPTDAAAKPRAVMRGHSDLIAAVTFHPDGKTIASAGYDHTIKLWDAVTGELRLTLEGHEANIIALAFTPDGNTLISADDSGAVKLWRAAAPGE